MISSRIRLLVGGSLALAAVAGFGAIAPTLAADPAPAAAASVPPGIAAAVAAPTRSEANVARDAYRHPGETLAFFGVKPTDTVVEIWPGGGWYSEILAPYLDQGGTLWAVDFWPDSLRGMRALQEKDAETYGAIKLGAFPADEGQPKVPDGSADVVLTFRNAHNWMMGYKREGAPYADAAFREMFAMLKPGGVLGVVDHRLPESADSARELQSGYVKVSTVVQLAEEAGFVFEGASEVNANPKDTADWERGVWTLPPRLANGDTDRDKYLAIGESDRMTLRFRKPAE